MSCKDDLLVEAALRRLSKAPSTLLEGLVRELRVSRRTLQNAINIITGKTFRELRDQLLAERVTSLLNSHPARGIKELSFELGYKSPRSFARAIKRACGSSPGQLRSWIISQLLQDEKRIIPPRGERTRKR